MSEDGSDRAVGRRAFVRNAAAMTAASAAAGVAAGQEGDEVTVELVNYAFEPGTEEALRIEPGTTVRFVWVTDSHNIVVESQPEGADWGGHEGIENGGYEYTFTFETEGTYEFVCTPHEQLGMQGTIEVGEGDDGGEAPVAPAIPEEAMTLGIATAFAFVATLGFAYVFMKYGGENPAEE